MGNSLTSTSATASVYLTTLAKVKSYLNITVSTYDDKLTNLLSVATLAIQKYTDRTLLSAEITEVRHGNGSNYLNLDAIPVTVDPVITYTGGDEDEVIDTDDYDTDPDTGTIFYRCGFVPGFRNYSIVYTAGYATVPDDLQHACCALVAALYRQSSRDTTLKSEKIGSYSYENFDSMTPRQIATLAPDAAELLKPYRRIRAL